MFSKAHVKPMKKSKVKKINQGFIRIYGTLPFRYGTLLAALTSEFRNEDYQFLAKAVNGNGFVGGDENQYSIFIYLALCQVTLTLNFGKQEYRSILLMKTITKTEL